MKEIKLGLLGFGNIGSGVVALLHDNADLITKRLGAKLILKSIADLDIIRPRPVPHYEATLTTDSWEVINDPEISIIIELIGGYEPARTFVLAAIEQGKHLVTANKALLATHGNEIFLKAQKGGVNIAFEASVGGTIPIIKTLKESLAANRIKSIFGIMNGTSNFILSKMTDENKEFNVVLKEAQDLGFAEADPTFDVEGIDTAHKLAIVLSLAYDIRINLKDFYREGITGVSQIDIDFARELGYRIKLLAIARDNDGRIEARIHPTMIPKDDLLANVNSNFNAFHLVGDASDSVFLYGQGSGMMPTASAVVGDIIDIARDSLKGITCRVPGRACREENIREIALLPMDEVITNYYLRFSALDKPGVLSRISGILGEKNISIATVIQKGRTEGGPVPVVMTTHKAREADVRSALAELGKLDVLVGPTVLIRMEDENIR
ncbi:MAG: homoserine dehydrogenase [Smithellaceae bacterium]|nr:homoserine dehydrogenase [Smithellaceae bacterium]